MRASRRLFLVPSSESLRFFSYYYCVTATFLILLMIIIVCTLSTLFVSFLEGGNIMQKSASDGSHMTSCEYNSSTHHSFRPKAQIIRPHILWMI